MSFSELLQYLYQCWNGESDSPHSEKNEFIFQLWEKVVCAAARRTLKEEFGAISIKDELFWRAWEHVSLSAYYDYIPH